MTFVFEILTIALLFAILYKDVEDGGEWWRLSWKEADQERNIARYIDCGESC